MTPSFTDVHVAPACFELKVVLGGFYWLKTEARFASIASCKQPLNFNRLLYGDRICTVQRHHLISYPQLFLKIYCICFKGLEFVTGVGIHAGHAGVPWFKIPQIFLKNCPPPGRKNGMMHQKTFFKMAKGKVGHLGKDK